MFFKPYALYIIVLLLIFVTLINSKPNSIVYSVNADDSKECCSPNEKSYLLPPIYCYRGNEKSVLNVFQTITVDLTIGKTDEFIIYQAVNQDIIEEQMLSDVSILSLNKIISYFWKQKSFTLNPFDKSCFSIKTNANFKLRIHSIALDSWRLCMFIIGIFLFGYSSRLSHNSLFYYLCGITIGVTASFIIIILLISRLIPKKKMMIGYLGASCMLSLYAIQMLIENLNMILILYYKYILGYIGFSVLVSFVICYRYGPVTNPRSIDLIRWTLQLIGLALITLCSFHLEAMVFIDTLCILFYYTKFSLPFRLFPKSKPKLRLLSEDEYIQQSLIETPKALEELRKYCKSPDCDTWKVISRLKNPQQFAEFIESSVHVSTKAVEEHEKEIEDYDTEYEGSELENENSDSLDDIKEIVYTSDSE
ncbi:nuclear envelope integral membrane protein 1a [Sipha flava]|uniref:Nuclear envelope integral membrane protein 1a n=1 Tax=Sipha flava TaxID=143950 RepID=A0A8B8G298_9HEMI|nr:nuclear envelope integral membrane protein 1a [Sipha flava]